MSLNNIKLEPFLVAEMYKDVLVENDDQRRQKPDPDHDKKKEDVLKTDDERTWKYLGDFKKKLLFIVDYQNAVHIPDDQLNFLTTILSACKLTLADVAVLNLASNSSRVFKDVQENFKSTVMIMFGITPKQFGMPIEFPDFQVQPFNNCTYLSAPTIGQMENDKLLKSKLWVSLKKIFGLS